MRLTKEKTKYLKLCDKSHPIDSSSIKKKFSFHRDFDPIVHLIDIGGC